MKQMALVAAESQGWPILEPVEVADLPRPVALNKDVCVVGTRPEVNLKLSSPLVSRTHAMFVADHDLIYLRDLASRNHTYLNDKPIREAVLRDGDVITLGKLTFRCKSGFDRPYDPTELHAPAAELRAAKDGKRIALNTRSTLIGSRDDCDVVLAGKDIEPSHAVIFQREGQWHVRDLRTVSGTWVNDAAVGQMELHPGDQIRICDARFVYQLAAEDKTRNGSKPPLAAKPATTARHPLDGEDDEQVELELADDTAGLVPEATEAVPDSVGLSDFDAADVRSEPEKGSAVDDDDDDELTPHDSSAHGVSFAGQAPITSPAVADSNVIPISLEELDEPAVASSPQEEVPAAESAFDIATEEIPSPPPLAPEASGEISLQSVLDEPMNLAPAAEVVATEAAHAESSTLPDIPVEDVPPAMHDKAEHAAPATTPAEGDPQPDDASEIQLHHPGRQDATDPKEKLTELLGHLAEDIAQVQSTWEEVRNQHADEPHADHPGSTADGRAGRNGQPADNPDAEPSHGLPGARTGTELSSEL